MSPRVLFLDIDGVLNHAAIVENSSEPLDRDCVARLNAILEASGAAVVISSTWRIHLSPRQIDATLRRYGFTGCIIGATPVIPAAERGEEIKTWLQVKGEGVTRFVILDDRDDMGDLRPHLVRTTWEEGLRDSDAERAIARFEGTEA